MVLLGRSVLELLRRTKEFIGGYHFREIQTEI